MASWLIENSQGFTFQTITPKLRGKTHILTDERDDLGFPVTMCGGTSISTPSPIVNTYSRINKPAATVKELVTCKNCLRLVYLGDHLLYKRDGDHLLYMRDGRVMVWHGGNTDDDY